MKSALVATNAQIVLDFLATDPGRQFIANEIQKATSLSRAGVNFALRQLVKEGLALREKKANLFFYAVDPANSVIRQLKILRITMNLIPIVKRIAPMSEKIALFGSCARGEDTSRSDVDLLVITTEPSAVRKATEKIKKLQIITKTPVQYAEIKKADPVFYEELSRGLVLWEKHE